MAAVKNERQPLIEQSKKERRNSDEARRIF